MDGARDDASGGYPYEVDRPAVPLCVDLEGTVVRGDLLIDAAKLLIKRSGLNVFLILFWISRGAAVLKAELAEHILLNPEALYYDRDVVRWLALERGAGRTLWLCSSMNERVAARVAEDLGFFEGVLASSRDVNLSGAAMAERLVGKFGHRGFDYCANIGRDLLVWKHARSAIAVHGNSRLEQDAGRYAEILRSIPKQARLRWATVSTWLHRYRWKPR